MVFQIRPAATQLPINIPDRSAPGYFTYAVTRLHLLHVIVVRLYVRKISVVILKPETVDSFGV